MGKYLYDINYQDSEANLCALEMRALFNLSIDTKAFFSDQKIDESLSPYFKSRLEILHEATSLEYLIEKINRNNYTVEGSKVQYLPVFKTDPMNKERKKITKEIGDVMEGLPSFNHPKIIYGVTYYMGKWYFGIVALNSMLWKKHISKPNSYSSSLSINTAKAIVNIAAKGDSSKKIIDPCCGVGTVLLEGHYSGYDIIGCDINPKVAYKARDNLKYYGYPVKVMRKDINDIEGFYDIAIVDLPYGNLSQSDEVDMMDIVRNAARISERQVLISSINLTEKILKEGLLIVDQSVVYKNRSKRFARYIWVCESFN